MTKDMMVKALSDFMAKNGGEMDLATYKGFGNDVPVKDYLLRRAFGSWNRVLSVVKKRYPVQVAVVKPKAKVEKPAPKKKAPVKKEVKDVKK
jgi:hypothetical protein